MEILRKLHQQQKDAEKPKPQLVQKKIKKLLRRTFNVGKDKFKPKVGVLLPNKTIRNNVTTKSFMIKQTPIQDIRKFLIKQGFIKHQIKQNKMILKQELTQLYRDHIAWLRDQDPLGRATQGFESAITFMMATDNSDLIPRFWEKTIQLDNIRNENIFDVLPELMNL